MTTVLVTGGAGYIGSQTVKELHKKNYKTVVLDNLVYGHRDAVNTGVFIQGDLGDRGLLETIFKTHSIDAVMHFSAYAYVGESVLNPRKYYHNNVTNTLCLLDAMLNYNVKKFIFSSSCATYGEPLHIPMTEDHPQKPMNPYGHTKFMVEQILRDYTKAYPLQYISLRYFNAAGADPDGEIGEDHDPETHLIPLALRAAAEASGIKKTKSGEPFVLKVFGNDYQTVDGTCVRDYIHVVDLASAHILALEKIMHQGKSDVFNLGNGEGYSVKEVIDTAIEVTGIDLPFEYVDRRQGDPAVLVGSSEKAKNELGWEPRYDKLSQIIETAWNWHKNHPEGFKSKKSCR